MTVFAERVLRVVKKIPPGKTLTYKEVAGRAGYPNAYRAVGNVLHNYDSTKIKVPCHRVIKSDGSIGGYAWGVKNKAAILKKEGVLLKVPKS